MRVGLLSARHLPHLPSLRCLSELNLLHPNSLKFTKQFTCREATSLNTVSVGRNRCQNWEIPRQPHLTILLLCVQECILTPLANTHTPSPPLTSCHFHRLHHLHPLALLLRPQGFGRAAQKYVRWPGHCCVGKWVRGGRMGWTHLWAIFAQPSSLRGGSTFWGYWVGGD